MKEASLKLQDRTILLVGPFSGVTQAIIRTMTEMGADVAYIDNTNPNAGRYTEGINEAREVHQHYGRAAYFNFPMNEEKEINEALGRMVESFGRMDAMVNTHPLAWGEKVDHAAAISRCEILTGRLLPFFEAKLRGRLIFLLEDPATVKFGTPSTSDAARSALLKFIETQAALYRAKNVTVNGLSLGLTEEFILRTFPGSGSIRKSLEELKKTTPELKIVETNEIGLATAYLAGGMSASLTGQVLRLTQGMHL
jgi:NAD(P)-dependent dehydrogenase (short-subunit alcohol dehydrogenase family)